MRKLKLSLKEKRDRAENNFKKVFLDIMDKTDFNLDKMTTFLDEFMKEFIFKDTKYPEIEIPLKTDVEKFYNLLEEYKFIKYTFYSEEYDSEQWQELMSDPNFYEKDEVYCKLLDGGIERYWNDIEKQMN